METMYAIAYLSIQKLEQGRLACTVGSHQSYTGLQINSKVKVLIDERLHTQHTHTCHKSASSGPPEQENAVDAENDLWLPSSVNN